MNSLKKLLSLESASGLILFTAAGLALLLDNSAWSNQYQHFLTMPIGSWGTSTSWINNGLMTLFFLMVGLELKREMIAGQLASRSKIILPGIAALGGMILPALIYWLINRHSPATQIGWPIPVATDIAFALGALSLFGKRVPLELKLFLLTLAIIDDLGAIIIIAFFHLEHLSFLWLSAAFGIILILMTLHYYQIRLLKIYLLLGVLLWFCILQSGIHATLAGVILALLIPMNKPQNPAATLEKNLAPWVTFGIMPLFAFANSGIHFESLNIHTLNIHLMLGVILGLCIGKQIGIFGLSALLIKLKWAKLPNKTSWLMFYGVSLLCGIGFTMSLFLGSLAFQNTTFLTEVKLSVMVASLISGVLGCLILRVAIYQNPDSCKSNP